MAVYRIPLKKVYKKKHIDGDPTWNDIYGNAKCHACKKSFVEGDTYVVIVLWKKHADGSESPIHKFQHTDCANLKDNLPVRTKQKQMEVKRK